MDSKEQDYINQLKKYSLSNTDIDYILNPDTKINTLEQINEVFHIDEIFDKKGRCILFYRTYHQLEGHWIALLKRSNIIEYFDSYGSSPMETAKTLNVSESEDKKLNGGYHILLRKIRDAGYDMVYNNIRFQDMNNNVATCGRHAVLRLIFYKLDIEQFQHLLKNMSKDLKAKFDDIVVGLTYPILKK